MAEGARASLRELRRMLGRWATDADRQALAAGLTVLDPEGRVLLGNPDRAGDRAPVLVGGAPIAHVIGDTPQTLAALLSLLVRQHRQTRAVGAEALNRNRELNLHQRLSRTLAGCLTVAQAGQAVLDHALPFFRASAGAVVQPSGAVVVSQGALPAWASKLARSPGRDAVLLTRGDTTLMCACIVDEVVGDDMHGVLLLAAPSGTWTEADLGPLAAMTERLATVLSNLVLHESRLTAARERDRLTAAHAQSQATSQAKSALVASMSHELRTPLNAILGYSEMIEEELPGPEHDETRTDLQRIRSAGRRLLTMLSDLVYLAKIEAGRISVDPGAVYVDDVCEEALAQVHPLAQRNDNTLRWELSGDTERVLVDSQKLRRILLALLSNACKLTSEGDILLTARVEPGEGNEPEQLQIAVVDTGIGMTAAQMAGVFQQFARTSEKVRRQYGGSGLGLAITRQLCRLLGGDVTVHSEPGVGSTFAVHLPVRRHGAQTPADTM